MPNIGDVALRYSGTPANRGIYLYGTGGWVKQSAPTVDMISKAWPDICRATIAESAGGFPGGPYGTITDYIGTGVNFQEVLAVQTAFVNKLFAQFIKVQSGGSIRGGDRYDESGATIDGTKPGFYIAASGACKFAGIEFEGSGGGGVQWGGPHLAGTPISLSIIGFPALAALNGTDVALVDAETDTLRTYRFNGSTWVLVGSALSIPGTSFCAIATLSNTDIAFIDVGNDQLRTYRFNGATWSLIGTPLSLPVTGRGIGLAALNSTDVAFAAFIDGAAATQLRVYRFNGTTWGLVGTPLSVEASALTALNSTDVAVVVEVSSQIRTYRFTGTGWSQVGASFSIPTPGAPAITALNGTDVAYIDAVNDQLRIYRFNGATWNFVGSAGSTGITGAGYPALAGLSGTDVAYIDNLTDQLRLYRFSFATSIPYARTLTGF